MVYEEEYEEVADADEQDHSQYRQDFVPYPPRYNMLMKRPQSKSEHQTATKGDGTEQQRQQQFVALIHIQPKGLQQEED